MLRLCRLNIESVIASCLTAVNQDAKYKSSLYTLIKNTAISLEFPAFQIFGHFRPQLCIYSNVARCNFACVITAGHETTISPTISLPLPSSPSLLPLLPPPSLPPSLHSPLPPPPLHSLMQEQHCLPTHGMSRELWRVFLADTINFYDAHHNNLMTRTTIRL